MHGKYIGMGQYDGGGRAFDRIQRGAQAGMAAIDDDARLIQALDEFHAEAAQSRIGSLLATVADAIFDVVRQLDHSNAQRLIKIDPIEIIVDGIGTLEMQIEAKTFALLCEFDVVSAPYQEHIVTFPKQAMPSGELLQGRMGIARGDRRRKSRDAAFAVPVKMAVRQRANGIDHDAVGV